MDPILPWAVCGVMRRMRDDCRRHAGSSATVRALFCCFLAALAPAAGAEKADREKPVNLEADRVTIDDAKQVATFEGNVVLTQGTL